MGTVSKVFLFLIPLVVLVVVLAILFRPEEGLFDKVKGLILGAKDILPAVSVGLEEQKAEVTVPDLHKTEILELGNTLQGMLGSGKENCFANYGGISELSEAATSLRFELRGDNTFLTVYGGAGGKQVITDLSVDFPDMKPCVIAGAGGVSKNFFKYFIEGEKLTYPYFSPVNSLTLISDSNDINVPDFDLVNDLEENGWLFTPDGEHICFFPTNTVADYNDEGIDNDYFTVAEENS